MNYITSYTDIANMAIDWCGGALSIDDIDNINNPDAVLCKRNLPLAVVTELDKYEWGFARRSIPAVLDADIMYKIDGYYCYSLPNDFSRLSMYMFDAFKDIPKVSEYQWGHMYFIQNNHLYTRMPLTTLRYVSNNVPITEWPSLFCDVVALNLAQRIVGKIKGLDADIGFFDTLYRSKLKDARRADMITMEAMQGGESVLQLNRIVP